MRFNMTVDELSNFSNIGILIHSPDNNNIGSLPIKTNKYMVATIEKTEDEMFRVDAYMQKFGLLELESPDFFETGLEESEMHTEDGLTSEDIPFTLQDFYEREFDNGKCIIVMDSLEDVTKMIRKGIAIHYVYFKY